MKKISAMFILLFFTAVNTISAPAGNDADEFIKFIKELNSAYKMYENYILNKGKTGEKDAAKFLSMVSFPFTFEKEDFGDIQSETYNNAGELISAKKKLSDMTGVFIAANARFAETVYDYSNENGNGGVVLGYNDAKDEYYYSRFHNGPSSYLWGMLFKKTSSGFKLVKVVDSTY